MKLWKTKKYYEFAGRGSRDVDHPGMKELMTLSKKATNILDLGCGEGTRLSYVAKGKSGAGVDISANAISLAKESYPQFSFKKADLEKLTFKDGDFDLVYSAYVLEHLNNPEKVIDEAIRVLRNDGYLVLIAPNYGAPNRASPVFRGSRFKKLFGGLVKDFFVVFKSVNSLQWDKVTALDDITSYAPDTDATTEPYLGTLMHYLIKRGLEIKKYSSCWGEELPGAKVFQRLIRVLGETGLFPFKLWGPHLIVVAYKA